MDYEKKYKNALEIIKKWYNSSASFINAKEDLENALPELKESEDERIRRWIINYLDNKALNSGIIREKTNIKNAIAWLEKQGEKGTNGNNREIPNSEQKPADKVEPKFKVGYFVISNKDNSVHQIKSAIENTSNGKYAYDLVDGGYISTSHEIDYHLWTIQDAKDGDVLVTPATQEGDKECPFIFKGIDENGIVRYHVALLQNKDFKISNDISNVMGYANAGYHVPATREQRALLFQKMHEAGYEWDAENKLLKKIEQKPVESDNNEKIIRDIIRMLDKVICYYKNKDNNSEMAKYAVISAIERQKEWLKSLRPQSKQEWSEEDEDILNTIINHFEIDLECTENDDIIRWLKFLKDRVLPQNTWKPSDEQIRMIEKVVNGQVLFDNQYESLKELLEQLKAL